MCGVASIYLDQKNAKYADLYLKKLLLLSQSRGVDATGISVHNISSGKTHIYKRPLCAADFIKTKDFSEVFLDDFHSGLSCISHNRLATNGSNAYSENNHPVYSSDFICVQNGIVTNFDSLSKLTGKSFSLDTYSILNLFENSFHKNGLSAALRELYDNIEGENTVIFQIPNESKLIHATNCGTLYYMENIKDGFFVSASEKFILEEFSGKLNLKNPIVQLPSHHALIVDYDKKTIDLFLINSGILPEQKEKTIDLNVFKKTNIINTENVFFEKMDQLKRCTKCILPETFPGIKFDESGICNICKNYTPLTCKSEVNLEEIFEKYRSQSGKADCLVAFSGGRDSSYGLHLIKEKYKMNPVAYSYDWGMVTDLARRNQSRLCGALGIEHIWVSADIKKKRDNIRKCVNAWIKKPNVGMIPLFMAGDKTYFYHANRVMKNMGLDLIIFCPNNLERTNFKANYCGLNENDFGDQVHKITSMGKIKLLSFYAWQYLSNPKYINSSITDVAAGYLSYYVMNQDFLYLFDYERWDEQEVDTLLKEKYDWEWDPDYPSSWRIGDGTAPLYNMIYYMYAGFTENDCFRSNQIREGMITRDLALKRCQEENKPRLKEIESYCKMVCVNFVDLLNAIYKIQFHHKKPK